MKKKILKYSLIGALVLGLILAVYFFTRKGGAEADKYAALRANKGGWDDTADDSGIWVVVLQDLFEDDNQHPDYNPTSLAAIAFFKAHNLYPSAWHLRSSLYPDFQAWYAQNPGVTKDFVTVGEDI